MKIEIFHIYQANSKMFEYENLKIMNINMGRVVVQVATEYEGTWLELFKNRKFLDFLFSLNLFESYYEFIEYLTKRWAGVLIVPHNEEQANFLHQNISKPLYWEQDEELRKKIFYPPWFKWTEDYAKEGVYEI